MTVFSVITLLGGLAFFLYGMHVMSSGLEKMSGSKLEKILKRATDNRFTALALGAGITIAIQSSSAMTVMLVGLVNSGNNEARTDDRCHNGLKHRNYAYRMDTFRCRN